MKTPYEISGKLPNTTNFSKILHHFEIRLHLPISVFSAKCNLNQGNLIGPRTVIKIKLRKFEVKKVTQGSEIDL